MSARLRLASLLTSANSNVAREQVVLAELRVVITICLKSVLGCVDMSPQHFKACSASLVAICRYLANITADQTEIRSAVCWCLAKLHAISFKENQNFFSN